MPAGGRAAPAAAFEIWIAEARTIRDWVGIAPAGTELTYARTYRLPPKSEAAAAAKRLSDSGYVFLYQRPLGGGLSEYVMRRLRARRGSIGRDAAAAKPALDEEMLRMWRLLDQLARNGRPCPTNAMLAQHCRLRDGDVARYVLRRLIAAKRAEVSIVDPVSGARVVTLQPGGRSTALPAGGGAA